MIETKTRPAPFDSELWEVSNLYDEIEDFGTSQGFTRHDDQVDALRYAMIVLKPKPLTRWQKVERLFRVMWQRIKNQYESEILALATVLAEVGERAGGTE